MENQMVETETKKERMKIGDFLIRFSRIGVLLLLSIGISLANPNFLKITNLVNVLRTAAPQMIISFGMTIVLLTGGIDLSIGSVVTVTSITAGYLLTQTGLPWYFAIIGSLGAGAVSGLITGLLVSTVKLPSPVASYGMLWVGKGVAFAIMGATPFFGFADQFRFLGRGTFLKVPMPIWVLIVISVSLMLLLKYTTLGRNLYAVGANPHAARASGLKVRRTLLMAYILSGVLAAIGGIILAGRLNAVDQDLGASYLLLAIASPVIGGTSMAGGQGGIAGTIIGSLIMIVVSNGMNLLKIPSVWQQLVIGIVVVLAVFYDVQLKKRS